ncbi:MAG TPA: VTT domain-containing protein [Sphaerochaeta sp.]|nr:VTT domain-containing protein [Sphaerochaeta sp.]
MKIIDWVKSLFTKESYILEDGSLDVKKLLIRTFVASLPILLLYLLVMRALTHMGLDNSAVVQQFIIDFGVKGVAVYVYIVDLFVLPLSVDLIWPFVMGWNPLVAIFVMGTSSVAGAFTAYLLGRLIGLIPAIKRWILKASGTQAEELITKYGAWAIVISGLTPLPFSTICTLAGIVKLKPHLVMLSTMIRYVRMAIYYFIFSGLIYIS